MGDFCDWNPARRKNLVRECSALLKAGGPILLDACRPAVFPGQEERAAYRKNLLDRFWPPNPYCGFLNTFKYPGATVALGQYAIVEPNGIRSFCDWLQYYSPGDPEAPASGFGLTIREMRSDVAGARYDPGPGEFAVVMSMRLAGETAPMESAPTMSGLIHNRPRRCLMRKRG